MLILIAIVEKDGCAPLHVNLCRTQGVHSCPKTKKNEKQLELTRKEQRGKRKRLSRQNVQNLLDMNLLGNNQHTEMKKG